MPYIRRERRIDIDAALDYSVVQNVGELNYAISRLADDLLSQSDRSYAGMSAVRAAITDAADEFYRRLMVPYEDSKIIENGDVYQATDAPSVVQRLQANDEEMDRWRSESSEQRPATPS